MSVRGVEELLLKLSRGVASLDRAWRGGRSRWDRLGAWIWTIGHPVNDGARADPRPSTPTASTSEDAP